MEHWPVPLKHVAMMCVSWNICISVTVTFPRLYVYFFIVVDQILSKLFKTETFTCQEWTLHWRVLLTARFIGTIFPFCRRFVLLCTLYTKITFYLFSFVFVKTPPLCFCHTKYASAELNKCAGPGPPSCLFWTEVLWTRTTPLVLCCGNGNRPKSTTNVFLGNALFSTVQWLRTSFSP